MNKYTKEELHENLEKHNLWLNNMSGGIAADFSGADISGVDFSGVDLRGVDFSCADLSNANFRDANLNNANLSGVNLTGADLSCAKLQNAHLSNAILSNVNLSNADLCYADLYLANLNKANLCCADLSGADLTRTNLSGANLSGTKGLVSSVDFIKTHFGRTEDGYIAYKTFGSCYDSPEAWKIEVGSVIEENVNFDRSTGCGSGINVAPLEWVRDNYPNKPIWKVLIRWEWLCGVCVPYMTDGKIRCERVELLEVVE